MIGILDIVSLRRERPDLGLPAGAEGSVLHVHDGAYEIEFLGRDGRPALMASISAADIVLANGPEVQAGARGGRSR